LADTLLIAALGSFLALSSWEQIHNYAVDNAANIKRLLPDLPAIPSADTIARAVAGTKFDDMPAKFAEVADWFIKLSLKRGRGRPKKSEVFGVAFDGKSLVGGKKRGHEITDTHIVHASMGGMVLSFCRVAAKSNEIPAMRQLVITLNNKGLVKGKLITADAMGCHRQTAGMIDGLGGYFLFIVKDNQPKLNEQIAAFFNEAMSRPGDFAVLTYKAEPIVQGGNVISRVCHAIKVTPEVYEWCPNLLRWPWVKEIALIEKTIIPKKKGKEAKTEIRYLITNLEQPPQKVLEFSVGHWQVETVHLMLDKTYREDRCLISIGDAAENLSSFRKLGLNRFVLAKLHHPGTTLMDFIDLARMDWSFFMKVLTEKPWDLPNPKEERKRLGLERCANFGPIMKPSKKCAKSGTAIIVPTQSSSNFHAINDCSHSVCG
jgi:predicted transposase YbfD/YdcC